MSDNFSQAHQEDTARQDTFVSRLAGAASTPQSAQPVGGKEVYLPYGTPQEGREEEGLTFYHEDHMISVKFYAHLTDILCTRPEYLTLIYMDCVYTFYGRNLQELIPLIKRHKVDAVQCYEEERFIEPLQGAVIYSIVRESHEEVARKIRG